MSISTRRAKAAPACVLLLETLDATGTPISREIVYVDSEVPLYNRAYFEVRPNTPGPAYRVTVYSADWGKMGGL